MIIENEMSSEIYIETIKTSGTIVTRDFSLLGESIGKGEYKR